MALFQKCMVGLNFCDGTEAMKFKDEVNGVATRNKRRKGKTGDRFVLRCWHENYNEYNDLIQGYREYLIIGRPIIGDSDYRR